MGVVAGLSLSSDPIDLSVMKTDGLDADLVVGGTGGAGVVSQLLC